MSALNKPWQRDGSRPGAAVLVLLLHVLALAAFWTLKQAPPSESGRIAVRLITPPAPRVSVAATEALPEPRPMRLRQAQASIDSLPSPAPMPQPWRVEAIVLPPTGAPGAGEAEAAPTPAAPAAAARASPELTEPVLAPKAAPARVAMAPAKRGECMPAPHPPLLRERGIEGVVRLRVWVDEAGRAARVELAQSSGFRLFDEAASRQAQACPYEPARRDGVAVGSWVEFPVRFALRSADLG